MTSPPRFLVARNPDEDSTLPILVRLPIGPDGLVLKTRDTWPRTSKLYCHRGESWPEGVEVLEDVAVRSCVRRGAAIDLVLARSREQRSQFVFARLAGGREAIFWQSARTARTSRPGVRIPTRRAGGLEGGAVEIVIDTRERYPYRFAKQQATTRRAALSVGDYAVEVDGAAVAIVERKSLSDLARALVDGSLQFRLAELADHGRAAVVVEDRYSALFKLERVQAGWVVELLARHQARYPTVPIVFCETRPLAEEWTFRFLGASLALVSDEPEDPTAPREWRE